MYIRKILVTTALGCFLTGLCEFEISLMLLKLSVHSPDSKTVLVLGIGPFLVMSPLFESCNWDFNGKKANKNEYPQKMWRKYLL